MKVSTGDPRLNFDEIILCERYSDGFLGAALDDKLVKIKNRRYVSECIQRAKQSRYKRKALELYALFDTVHLRHFHPDILLPSLEREGHITIDCRHARRAIDFFEGIQKDTKNALERHRQLLREIYYLKPLIVEEALKSPQHDWEALRKQLGAPPRRFYSAAFELVGASFFPVGWDMEWEVEHFYKKVLCGTENIIFGKLLDMVDSNKSEDSSDIGFFPIWALAVGDSYLAVLEESSRRGCPVAWGFAPKGHLSKIAEPQTSVSELGRAFRIVRCALREEGLRFPVIECFADAHRLRNDRRIKDFREVLAEFVLQIAKGESIAASKIRRDVQRANMALASAGQCRKLGDLVTCLSLPASIAESLLACRVSGLILSAVGLATITYSKIQERRHRWILFGQG